MYIGIKYCGGCNCTYNRSRQIELIQKKYPEHIYCSSSDRTICDIWLIICGCQRKCADISGLTATQKMFILASEYDFTQIHQHLETIHSASVVTNEKIPVRQLSVGQKAVYSKRFSQKEVIQFAMLTGDTQRLHTDAAYAAHSPYKKPIVHGVLAASLISTVMGTLLPGEGTILIDEQIRFLNPVFYEDLVTAEVTFISCIETPNQYIGSFSGLCRNQYGDITAAGRFRQVLHKDLFYITNPKETITIPETDYF